MQADPESAASITAQIDAAKSLRNTGRAGDALDPLRTLESRMPGNAYVHQELGHCLLALGKRDEALSAYLKAVYRNDTLADSWRAIHDLAVALKLPAQVDSSVLALQRLARLPPAVITASSHLNDGNLSDAEDLIRKFLQQHGPHVAAMRVLAQIGMKLQVLDDAEMLLEHVLRMDPQDHDARFEFASVLLERRRYALALKEANLLLTADPSNPNYRRLHAKCCDGAGLIQEALTAYRELLAQDPSNEDLRLALAHLLQTSGDLDGSLKQFRLVSRLSPESFANASWGLANLKTYRFEDADIERMRNAERSAQSSPRSRYSLCFALGKALEDRQRYAESFEYYARGNALKRAELRYDARKVERSMLEMATVCTAELFRMRQGSGCQRRDPIFILGMPRSGSTLIEQILSAHSEVDGTLELPDIPRLTSLFRARQGPSQRLGYPASLPYLEPAQLRELGEIYMDETHIHRRGAPFFIDKLPNNFREIGFIHLILPNAKIIDARRGAMACCFGNFKQLFVAGQEFSYSQQDIGQYYRWYRDLMDHWDQVLPGKVLHIQYEDVVQDLEASVRRLLEFCGLEFQPACLEFHRLARRVRTVSSEQVRQPIYREGLDQWKHYEQWLEPLKSALGDRCDS